MAEYAWISHVMSCLICGGGMGQVKNVKIFYKTFKRNQADYCGKGDMIRIKIQHQKNKKKGD